ncbi:molecular chaperone DnaK [Methylophaga sp. OBS4]|uniref:molecular chaperone DnaK n=1 Tax=Methylophaga sp. OBS4 TaxID=2991935 RepID=UPI00225B5466|nr:molecular chaperone DnaK [Methylophaga sp. OBS4]MCX4186938.1 molecular chaperone DnaK [Methylophaga sp. OBS4]
MAIIGIDLGTSNSAAAVLRGGKPVIIPSAEGISLGGKAFPSYVAITADGQTLIGEPARRQASANPEGTATVFKRSMGQRKKIQLRNKSFSPEQLSAFLLQKIKRDAEAFLGEPVSKAVVTVPAYFDDNQRSATKDACKIAGLEVVRLVNEPTAASLAYGLDRLGEELRIVVIDFGGGTLDVTVMEFGNGVFEVKATSGDTQLGGTDMDENLLNYLAEKYKGETGIDVLADAKASARLKEAAEIAKIELSTSTSAHISLPYLTVAGGAPQHLEMDLTRTELERHVYDVVERCGGPIEQALQDANIRSTEVDRIVFVGGPTRMPIVREYFEGLFGRKAEMGIDPMECVACGAAIQAGVLSGEVGDIVLVDVTPLTLGVETLGGVATPLIARNSPIPVKHTETFTTAADMQTAVTIHIYQGERPLATDNTSLGEFNLEGLVPAPRGVPKVDVTFDIDANGILNVAAEDQATRKSQSISISGSTRLSDEEKQRLVNEAEKYAEEDKKRREDVDKLNNADNVCYQAEKLLAEYRDKLSDGQVSQLEQHMFETRDAMKEKNAVLASQCAAQLEKVIKEAGAAIYAQTTQETAAPHAAPDTSRAGGEAKASGSGPRGKVVDADYTESG